MLADVVTLREVLVHDVVHNTQTMEQTNFFRGQIAMCERFILLPEELKEWKESHK